VCGGYYGCSGWRLGWLVVVVIMVVVVVFNSYRFRRTITKMLLLDGGRRGFLLRLTWDASVKINDQNHVAMATTCGGVEQ
jgi:hypothetical protein